MILPDQPEIPIRTNSIKEKKIALRPIEFSNWKNIASDKEFFANVGKPRRKPLRTFREFAEEFMVTEEKFRLALQEEGAPKPPLIHKNNNPTRNSWYSIKEMRDWWNGRRGS